jgi:hypothetical protein
MTGSHAKALRANMTEAERRLWYFLRAHRFAGMKFKRQALIGRYIVDFVSFQNVSSSKWTAVNTLKAKTIYGVRDGWKVRGFAF